jgi:hypothetical protein
MSDSEIIQKLEAEVYVLRKILQAVISGFSGDTAQKLDDRLKETEKYITNNQGARDPEKNERAKAALKRFNARNQPRFPDS